jgi:xylan 1,4-beta-xylosidase
VAVKKVNARLRVGGPATAQAAWVDALIQHCAQNKIPLDFVSTHVYGNDSAKDVFGTDENIPRDKMVCRAVSKVHDQIKASSNPTLPLIWSEFNASYANEHQVTDALYMGPWLGEMIRDCDGLVDIMSYWTFSDVFEEQGVVKTPFYGGYGLIAAGGIPKPAFGAFELLHKLGTKRLAVNSDSALVTTRADGTLVLALWNYAPEGQAGTTKTVTVRLKGTAAKHASISRVDAEHGDYHAAYEEMGSPDYPTQAQVKLLREAVKLGASESVAVKGGEFTVTIPGAGLAIVEVK